MTPALPVDWRESGARTEVVLWPTSVSGDLPAARSPCPQLEPAPARPGQARPGQARPGAVSVQLHPAQADEHCTWRRGLDEAPARLVDDHAAGDRPVGQDVDAPQQFQPPRAERHAPQCAQGQHAVAAAEVDVGFVGCSLTAAEVDKREGWFEVWLIPETLRMPTFAAKREGNALNVEIERQTQVFVDTVRDSIDERLGPLVPALERLLREQGVALNDVARPVPLPR